MQHLRSLLDPARVRCHLPAASRKRALELIAELLCDDTISADDLFDALMARERLGSTALGKGVAVPHCRIAAQTMRAAMVSLPAPIDFEAGDSEPVDLLFVLVVPEGEQKAHLEALSNLAQVFDQPTNRAQLRACHDHAELFATFCQQMDASVGQSVST